MPEKLKDLYYSLEEKYYGLLDKVNKAIPVYKLTDRIDKVIPSFLLFVAVIFVLVFFGAMTMLGAFAAGEPVEFSFLVQDNTGEKLGGISLSVLVDGTPTELETNPFGETDSVQGVEGAEVIVRINEEDFEPKPFTKTFTLSKETESPIRIELKKAFEEAPIQRTIRLVSADNRTQLLSGEEFELSFECTNPEATPPANITVTRGEVTVNEPSGCGGLLVTAVRYVGFGTGYESVYDSILLSGYSTPIALNELGSGSGTLVVKAFFDSAPVNGIHVELFDDIGISTGERGYTSNGQYTFEVAPGYYTVRVFDETGEYGSVQDTAYVVDNERRELMIYLEKNVKGYVKIQVVEKGTQKMVDKAKVSLFLGDEELFTQETDRDQNSVVGFPVTNDSVFYTVLVDHEDYLIEKRTDIAVGQTKIELTKFTGINGATLKVRVLDQEGRAVKNARVSLFRDEGLDKGFSLFKRTPELSDVNGLAKFTRVINGKYKAFAFKGSNNGWSDVKEFTQRMAQGFELTVAMQIPDGTLKVRVLDDEGNPLQHSFITFYDKERNQDLGTFPVESVNGEYEFTSRADKSVYFRVRKEGFSTYQSVSYSVPPEGTREATVEMQKEFLGDKIKVEFLGLFENEKKADNLAVGGEYTARLQLWIPKGKIADEGGIHLRVGKEAYMENDLALLKKANDSDASIKKYSTFTGNDYQTDVGSLTVDEAKWANIVWKTVREGIYNAELTVKVKETAALNDKIIFYYRGWVSGDTGTERFPADLAPEGHGLYSAVKEKIYSVGVGTVCDERFCFYATIKDLREQITRTVTDSYNAKIERSYELEFDVMNNHESFIHNNSNIRIENENKALEFHEYSVRNADNRPIEGTLLEEKHKLPWIDLGDFRPNSHVHGKIILSPKLPGDSAINIKIVSKNEVVFEKEVLVGVEAMKGLSLEFEPTKIPAGIETSIKFTVKKAVKDSETGLEEGNALLKVKDRFGNVLDSGKTSDDVSDKGEVTLTIPAQEPNALLVFSIEKEEFNPFEESVRVDGNLVEFRPSKLGVSLNTKKAPAKIEVFTIKNTTNFDLKLKELSVAIDSKGLLDSKAMNDWLYNSFAGITIPKNAAKEIQFKGILSQEGTEHSQRETFKGSVDAVFEANGINWSYSLPLTVSVGIGGEVETPNCLSLTRKEWNAMTEGETIEVAFELENNCVIGGKPVELRDLEAMVNWKSNHVGTYTVDIEGTQVELRSGYFRRISGIVEKDRTLTGLLIFTPKGGMNGLSDAEIVFRARNPLEGKDQILEDEMQSKIRVVNLLDCISFSKDVLNIPLEGKDSFTIKTSGCGGTTTFELDSKLELSKETIALGDSETSQEIEVYATADDFPGQYPLWVSVRGAGQIKGREVKLIEARVKGLECIQLSKYELDVFDDPEEEYDGYDTLQLYNNCYEKPVKVKIKMKSIGRAMQKALFPAVMQFASELFSGEVGRGKNDYSQIIKSKNASLLRQTQPFGRFNIFSVANYFPSLAEKLGSIPGMTSWQGRTFWVFAGATLWNYFNQEDIEFTTIQDDVEVKNWQLLKALRPELEEEGIEISVEDSYTKYLPGQKGTIGVTELVFENKDKLVQESPLHPLYRIFKINSERHEYQTEYEAKDFEEGSAWSRFWKTFSPGTDPTLNREKPLKEKPSTQIKNKFNLQFNSFNPTEVVIPSGGLGWCRLGDKVGITGENAGPRIRLQWDWDLVNAKYICDEAVEGYIYCDATQFSIELLKKINELASNGGLLEEFDLVCPSGQCGAASTLNLGKWVEATEYENGSEFSKALKEKASSLISFNTHLIRDGYSADFQKDFDEYAATKAFFKTPQYYHSADDSETLRNYFKEPELFKFDYVGAPNAPLSEPGVYKAEIEIIYSDDSWKLFKNGQPNAKIVVHLTRIDRPVPPSPFYYLPFDGVIGIDKTRTGYGINYAGEEVKVSETGDLVLATDITNSNPVHLTTVQRIEEFRKTNMDERGVLLKLQRIGKDRSSMLFAPSHATPVVMKITDNGSESVYAFYSVRVSGEPQNIGPKGLTNWSGLGTGCRDFGDRITASYKETPDMHGASEQPNHSRDPYEYGFEPSDWYSPKKYGTVFLQTIFFTPFNRESALVAERYSQGLEFIALRESGENIDLRASDAMNQEIESIERILELIKEETVCVSGHESDSLAEFWWNPGKVLEPMESKIANLDVEGNCIK